MSEEEALSEEDQKHHHEQGLEEGEQNESHLSDELAPLSLLQGELEVVLGFLLSSSLLCREQLTRLVLLAVLRFQGDSVTHLDSRSVGALALVPGGQEFRT